jgi:hypothetical protein
MHADFKQVEGRAQPKVSTSQILAAELAALEEFSTQHCYNVARVAAICKNLRKRTLEIAAQLQVLASKTDDPKNMGAIDWNIFSSGQEESGTFSGLSNASLDHHNCQSGRCGQSLCMLETAKMRVRAILHHCASF